MAEYALLWAAVLLLSSPAGAPQDGSDVADLIRRLGHDDPDVREAADAALKKVGSRAFPALEKALGHPSAEVRARAAKLLHSEHALKFLLNDPETPALQRLWNAVIETAIAKRPIPAAIWREFGLKGLPQDGMCDHLGVRDPLPPQARGAWIRYRLRDCATRALIDLASTAGVEGRRDILGFEGSCNCMPLPLPGDLAARLLKCEPDETTFEELYATIWMTHVNGEANGLASFSGEDWDIALRFWVQLRRRAGEKPLVLPAGRKEALDLVSRGPLIRGLASGLGRAFAHADEAGTCLVLTDGGPGPWSAPEQPAELKEVTAIYSRLLRLDELISRFFFAPELLQPAPARLPPADQGSVDDRFLGRVPGDTDLDEETLRVLKSLTEIYLTPHLLKEDHSPDAVTLSLIHAVTKRVVAAARVKPSSKE